MRKPLGRLNRGAFLGRVALTFNRPQRVFFVSRPDGIALWPRRAAQCVLPCDAERWPGKAHGWVLRLPLARVQLGGPTPWR